MDGNITAIFSSFYGRFMQPVWHLCGNISDDIFQKRRLDEFAEADFMITNEVRIRSVFYFPYTRRQEKKCIFK